ncbi:methyltransferase domain-containing protein [Hoyosella sp. G463]|uniref:Methyltransferase domain-containing protein n=1 Tax=Lolliginicoccus lacisalsi TaxID=2742202 RepID=A0A927JE47_9ACTN|nr:methyltransferase domain-containing protein [Lolliginicoccus lacisalsi]MBD8506697.1 methyltransferase domain-containing protein [Lolliginicoccus lacisalsi]
MTRSIAESAQIREEERARLGAEILSVSSAVRPGSRFLDVGAGPLSVPAARLGAQVTATSADPAVIKRLTSWAQREGLHLDARVSDGPGLPMPDRCFDVTASLNGIPLLPGMRQGVEELVRVTRPAGTVLIAAWGARRASEVLTFVAAALRAALPGIAPTLMDPGLPVQARDPQALASLLRSAGLEDVRAQEVSCSVRFRSGAHLWKAFAASNADVSLLVSRLPRSQCETVQRVLDGMLRERSGGSRGAVLLAPVNVATGIRPGQRHSAQHKEVPS